MVPINRGSCIACSITGFRLSAKPKNRSFKLANRFYPKLTIVGTLVQVAENGKVVTKSIKLVKEREEQPLSRQVVFFADSIDELRFHDWLVKNHEGLTLLHVQNGFLKSEELVIVDGETLTGSKKSVLVFPWAREKIVIGHHKERSTVNLFDSPVLEYRRSIVDPDGNSVLWGRVYWTCLGELEQSEWRQIMRILRWIYKHTIAIPETPHFRVFESVCHNQRKLDFGFGQQQEVSPPWSKKSNASAR